MAVVEAAGAGSWLSARNLAILGLAYVLWGVLYQVAYYHFFHPLRAFPGPFWGGVTRLFLGYHNLKGDEPQVLLALHKKHGEYPVRGVWFPVLLR